MGNFSLAPNGECSEVAAFQSNMLVAGTLIAVLIHGLS